MKKLLFCLISFVPFHVFAAEVGPVTIGVCPACSTKDKPTKSKTSKPKPKLCPTVKPCEKCKPEVRTVTIEKTVYAQAKKNTLSLLLGQDFNGLNWDRKGNDVHFHRGFGWVSGIRYERHLDETWSVSGEYLTNESGTLGVGFSW